MPEAATALKSVLRYTALLAGCVIDTIPLPPKLILAPLLELLKTESLFRLLLPNVPIPTSNLSFSSMT